MNSGGLAYESTLPAHGEALLEVEDSAALPEGFDAKDWAAIAFAFFAPIAAAYAAIVYGLYVGAHAVF